MGTAYMFVTVYSIQNCKLHRVDLRNHYYTGNLNHPCKTLLLSTYKELVTDTGIAHHHDLTLVPMPRDLLWKLCSDFSETHSSISTNNQILKLHNHLCIVAHFVHIHSISRTYGFDKILPGICNLVIQQRSPLQFLLKRWPGKEFIPHYTFIFHDCVSIARRVC